MKDTHMPMSMHNPRYLHASPCWSADDGPLQAKWLAAMPTIPPLPAPPLSIDQLTSRSLYQGRTRYVPSHAGRIPHLDCRLRYSPLIAWAGLLLVPVQAATKQAAALWTTRAMRGTHPLFPN